MTDAPFARPHYTLGDLDLGPVGDDAPEIARRLAAIDPWARAGRTPEIFRAYFATPLPGTHRFALRHDGTLVGALSIRHPFMRGPYIELIGLFPEAQGRGIARRIVAWMAAEVAHEGGSLWLCVTDWNTAARAAYTALGFVEVAPLPDLALPGITEIFMRRPLGSPRP